MNAYDDIPSLGTVRVATQVSLAAAPLSGRLFSIRPGIRGIAPNLWAGSSDAR